MEQFFGLMRPVDVYLHSVLFQTLSSKISILLLKLVLLPNESMLIVEMGREKIFTAPPASAPTCCKMVCWYSYEGSAK